MTRPTTAAPRLTVGAELEQVRLRHRARRLERALRRLRHARAMGSETGAGRRPGLDRAVADVCDELDEVRDRLNQPTGDGR